MLNQITSVLFSLDPMNTGCVENDVYDEYTIEAESILAHASDSFATISLEDAVINTFNDNFWTDCLTKSQVDQICAKLIPIFCQA